MDELMKLLQARKDQGNPVERDVATHAALLVSNGWPADKALDESERSLADAESEGGY